MHSHLDIGAAGKPPARGVPVPLLILAATVIAGAALWYFYFRKPQALPAAPVLTEQAKAYVRAGSLKLSNVNMGAKENFAKQMLVEITGDITNAGNHFLRQVDIVCVFHDPYGQVVWRELRPIVRENLGGLKPNQTRPFRLAFDNLPAGWNQAMPDLVIAQIQFG